MLFGYGSGLLIVCGVTLSFNVITRAGSPLPLSGKRFTPAQLVESLKHPTVSKLQRGSPYAFATDSNRRKSQGTVHG